MSPFVQTFLMGDPDDGHYTGVGVSVASSAEALAQARRELEGEPLPPHVLRVEEEPRFYRVREGDPDIDEYGYFDRCEPTDDGASLFWIVRVMPMMLCGTHQLRESSGESDVS